MLPIYVDTLYVVLQYLELLVKRIHLCEEDTKPLNNITWLISDHKLCLLKPDIHVFLVLGIPINYILPNWNSTYTVFGLFAVLSNLATIIFNVVFTIYLIYSGLYLCLPIYSINSKSFILFYSQFNTNILEYIYFKHFLSFSSFISNSWYCIYFNLSLSNNIIDHNFKVNIIYNNFLRDRLFF